MTIRFFTPMVLIATILSGAEIFSAEYQIQNYSIKDVIFYYKNNIEKKRTESTFQLMLFDELKDSFDELKESFLEYNKENLQKKIQIINTYMAQDSIHQKADRTLYYRTDIIISEDEILKKPEIISEKDYFALQVYCAYFYTKYFLAIKEENYEFVAESDIKEKIKLFVGFTLLGQPKNYNFSIEFDEELIYFKRSLDFLFSSDFSDSLIKKYVKNHEKKMAELFPESHSEESDEDSESILVNLPSNHTMELIQGIDTFEDTLGSTEEDLGIDDKIDIIDTSGTVEPLDQKNDLAKKTPTETITDNKQTETTVKPEITALAVEKKALKNKPESIFNLQNTFLGFFVVCLVAAGGGFYCFPEECSGFFKKSIRFFVQMGLE